MDEGLCRYKKLLRRRCAAVPSVSDKPSCSDKECANRAEAVLSVIPFVQNGRMVMTPKKQLHLPDSPLPPRGHRPPRSGRADAGDGRSAQRGRWQRGRAAAPRTYRRRRRRCCRWIGSSCPPHGKRRCPPSAHCVRHFPHKRGKLLCRYPKPSPLSRGAVNVSQSHIAVARVLGTFSHTTCYPISFVLWTCFLDRSARGTAQAVEGAQRRGCYTKSLASCSSPHSPQQNHSPY